MKKILNITILSLLLLPCLFILTACGGNNNNGGGNNGGGNNNVVVLETQEEMFQKFITAMELTNNYGGTYSSYAESEQITNGQEPSVSVSKIAYNNETKEAAYITEDDSAYYVKKSNDKFICYEHDMIDNIYSAKYVDKDFSYHQYSFSSQFGSELSFSKYNTLDELKDSLIKQAEETLTYIGVDPSIIQNSLVFEKKEDYYLLKQVSAVEDFSITENNVTMTINVSATNIITFTTDFLKGLNVETTMSVKTSTNNNGSVTEQENLSIMKFNQTFTKNYDSTYMETNFSAYPTDIQNASMLVNYYIDGKPVLTTNHIFEETFAIDSEVNQYIKNNSTISEWYLDEACTISASTITNYPAYNINLYAKSVPNDGYAVIVIKTLVNMGDYYFQTEMITDVVDISANVTFPTHISYYTNNGTVQLPVYLVTINDVATIDSKLTIENKGYYVINCYANLII